MIVAEALPRIELNLMGARMDQRDAGRQAQGDVVLAIEVQGSQRQTVGVRLALQPGLGQRRALIGRDRLIAQQRDRSGPAILAKQRRGRTAGVPCANDDDATRHVLTQLIRHSRGLPPRPEHSQFG